VALALVPWGRAPDLRKVGKRIPMPRNYSIYASMGQHVWISDHEQMNISYVRLNLAKSGQPPRMKVLPAATRFEMDTGKSYPMREVNRRFREALETDKQTLVNWWQPSTDGKWIAFMDRRNIGFTLGLLPLDGSRGVQWSKYSSQQMYGSP